MSSPTALVPPPPRMARASLRGFERLTVPFMEWLNLRFWPKTAIQLFVRHFSAHWVYFCTRNLYEVHGLENVRNLAPDAGVILVSNHRSFFDMYVTCALLYREARFLRRLFFPVRSPFFYDRPLGLFVNLAVSGGAMWPPVFRDDRRALNAVGLEQMARVLRSPGAVVGIHPEGTRGKGPDPYEFLPVRPGLGQLVAEAPPNVVVVPFFILGLDNSTTHQIRRNFLPAGKRGSNVRIWFGEAMTASDLRNVGNPQQITDHVFARIARMAEADRASHPDEDSVRGALSG